MEKIQVVDKFIGLIEKFVQYKITGKTFEKEICKLWNIWVDIETDHEIEDIIDIINELHSDVECYYSDPKVLEELRSEDSDMARQGMYLDEEQLRKLAKKKLEKLKKIIKNKVIRSFPYQMTS